MVARRRANDSQLEHVFELAACSLKSLASEPSWPGGDWRSCSDNMMGHLVFNRLFRVAGLGERWKFGQDVVVGRYWLERADAR